MREGFKMPIIKIQLQIQLSNDALQDILKHLGSKLSKITFDVNSDTEDNDFDESWIRDWKDK